MSRCSSSEEPCRALAAGLCLGRATVEDDVIDPFANMLLQGRMLHLEVGPHAARDEQASSEVEIMVGLSLCKQNKIHKIGIVQCRRWLIHHHTGGLRGL